MQLQEALKQWQDALRLGNWDITAEILPDAEFVKRHGTEYDAMNRIDRAHFEAHITIREDGKEHEYEYRLVHELAHILLIEIESLSDHVCECLGTEAKEMAKANIRYELEGAVHCISRALLRVRDLAQGDSEAVTSTDQVIEPNAGAKRR